MIRIAIGCDPNATDYQEKLTIYLRNLGYQVDVLGTEDAIYANTAIRVGEAVAANRYDRGILICGTGIGMSIAANKVCGVRAALLTDAYSAQRSVLSNNANVACFGAFTLGYKSVEMLVNIFLENSFQIGTASEPKVSRIDEYDMNRL